MIELPRACLIAGAIAAQRRLLLVRHQRPHPDRARLLARRHRGADRAALREPRHRRALAVRDARRRGRRRAHRDRAGARAGGAPGLEAGVCGEHGGDPGSIRFFHAAGLDYVSCSPFRVPVARPGAAGSPARPGDAPGSSTQHPSGARPDCRRVTVPRELSPRSGHGASAPSSPRCGRRSRSR